MSRVSYANCRLIPAPFVEFTKNYQVSDDGTKLNSLWNISIQGRAIAYMGSPDSSGNFWTLGGFPPDEVIEENKCLGAILRKQEAIRTLFNTDGLQLEWQTEFAGSAPVKCNPRIKDITFSRDLWFNFVEYTVNAEADVLYINGQAYGEDTFDAYIESATDSWEIEIDTSQPESLTQQQTYRLTHTVTAKGKRFYDDSGALVKEAWEQAKDWVTPRLGLDLTKVDNTGVMSVTGVTGFNHTRTQSIDEFGGSFSVNESWTLATSAALESFEVNVRTSAETGLTTVGVDGNIIGLETRNPSTMAVTTTKYTAASNKWSSVQPQIITRAQNYSGLTLNIIPLSTSVGRNVTDGNITYSYEYDNRPSNLIPTALSETISVNDSLQTELVAVIPVINRTKGPVLQPIGTSKEKRRTLDLEVVFPIPTGTIQSLLNNQKPSLAPATASAITSIVNAADPGNNGASVSYLEDNNERWSPRDGRYALTKTWIYE